MSSKSTRMRVNSLEQVKIEAAAITAKRLAESQNIAPKPAKPVVTETK